MTRYIVIAITALLFLGLCIAPGNVNSADPRMEDVFREQRNDVHSLAANMQQALKAGNKNNIIDAMIEEYLTFLHKNDTDKYPEHFRMYDWGYDRRKTKAKDDMNEIFEHLEPQDYALCRISIRPTDRPKRIYIDGNGKRYSDEEAKIIQDQITEEISDEIGYTEYKQKNIHNSSDDPDVYWQMRVFERDIHDIRTRRPDYPKSTAISEYEHYQVRIIPNKEFYLYSDIIEHNKQLGYRKFYNLYTSEYTEENEYIGGRIK